MELETSPEPRKFVDDAAAAEAATLQDVRNVMRSSERLGNMVA
jgi:cob(I)alamin adenosyltransferase